MTTITPSSRVADPSLADFACVSRVVEEIAIVQPRIIVVMGDEAGACSARRARRTLMIAGRSERKITTRIT